MSQAVLEHIRRHGPALSGQSLKLASFVAESYRRVAFMSARALAGEAGVSLPTVVRFVSRLGYAGYQEFSRAMQELVNLELTSLDRLEGMLGRTSAQPLHARVIARETESLKRLLINFPRREVRLAAERLGRAPAVVVAAARYLSPLARYFAYTLRKLRPGVVEISTLDSVAYDDLALVPRGSVLLAIGFARYATELVEFVEHARRQRLTVVAITDHPLSPIAGAADQVVLVPAAPTEFIGYIATPALTLLNVLVSEIALSQPDRARARIRALERVADRRRTYYGAATRPDIQQILAGRRDRSPRAARRPRRPGG